MKTALHHPHPNFRQANPDCPARALPKTYDLRSRTLHPDPATILPSSSTAKLHSKPSDHTPQTSGKQPFTPQLPPLPPQHAGPQPQMQNA